MNTMLEEIVKNEPDRDEKIRCILKFIQGVLLSSAESSVINLIEDSLSIGFKILENEI